jgi:hypothetical protein
MCELTRLSGPLVAAAYDFGKVRSIVDLGGGSGELLAEILQAHPTLRGAVYDSPAAMAGAAETFQKAGVSDRAQTIEGSFFDSVPGGHDVYLMKHIVHGWSDEGIAPVLEKVRNAMGSSGKLIVIEMLVPDTDDGTHPSFLDLQMLVGSYKGRERSRADFERLFRKSGLKLAEVIKTVSPTTLFVAEPG